MKDEKDDTYEDLVFVSGGIVGATIPSFIKRIRSYALAYYKEVQQIDFEEDSKLEIIDECAFTESLFKSITIPHHVTTIGQNAFKDCTDLLIVEIEEKSELQSIENYALFTYNDLIVHPEKIGLFIK